MCSRDSSFEKFAKNVISSLSPLTSYLLHLSLNWVKVLKWPQGFGVLARGSGAVDTVILGVEGYIYVSYNNSCK
jgi:hypothetical protein